MPVLRIPATIRAGLIAITALACAALIFLLFGGRGRSGKDGLSSEELRAEFAPRPVNSEELFLPAEPDFLPSLIRSRERRTSWTAEDAAPFWTDPARFPSKPLADSAAAAVDQVLEAVP